MFRNDGGNFGKKCCAYFGRIEAKDDLFGAANDPNMYSSDARKAYLVYVLVPTKFSTLRHFVSQSLI